MMPLPPLPEHLRRAIAGRVVEEGDCLIWTGRFNNSSPVVYWGGRYTPVRRALYAAQFPLRGDIERLWFRSRCGDTRCVAPGHIVASPPSEFMRHINRVGHDDPVVRLVRNSRISATRRKSAKLSDEALSEILLSVEPTVALAQRYGVSRTLIWRYRSGRSVRSLRVRPNPWMQLELFQKGV